MGPAAPQATDDQPQESNAPAPMTTSRRSGAPVDARAAAPGAAVATVGELTGVPPVEARAAGTGVGPDAVAAAVLPPGGVGTGVTPGVVGSVHEASATPLSAASMPQKVTGTLTPVPGLVGVPMGPRSTTPDTGAVGIAVQRGRHGAHCHGRRHWSGARRSRVGVGGLARVVRRPGHGNHHAAHVHGDGPVHRGALGAVSGRQVTDRWTSGVGMHVPMPSATATTTPQAVTSAQTSAA